MRRSGLWNNAALCGAVVGAGLSMMSGADAWSAPAPAPAAVTPAVDPAAMRALDRMGKYLRGLQTFEVTADTTTDEVVGDGMKLQTASQVFSRVRRPNGFMIQTSSDRKFRQFYYDGHSLTVAVPRMGFYARMPAPGTIAQVLDDAYDRFDIELPLVDLFYWGTEDTPYDLVRSAVTVGYARVGGVDCDQYAFRGEDLDWQIWIQRGDQPVPRKMVITTRDDPAKPQYVSVMTWKLNPTIAADAFTFVPPKDAAQIRVAERGK